MSNMLKRIRTIFLYGATLALTFILSSVIAGTLSGFVNDGVMDVALLPIIPTAFADVPPIDPIDYDIIGDGGDDGDGGGSGCP